MIAVMSGHFVQRGSPALADKWRRAEIALLGGVDLVLELPTVWAAAPAEVFAQGGAALLQDAGVVTHLSFGSECGDVSALTAVADCLDAPVYRERLREFLGQGLPFAVCRQRAAEALLGRERAALLNSPNNNLGVEYLRALRRLKSPICPITVRREGAGHDAPGLPGGDTASASQLRRWLGEGNWDAAAPCLLPGEEVLLAQTPLFLDAGRLERMTLARLRIMTAEDWAELPDSGQAEGLPDRLARAGRACRSLEEFYQLAKSKRYSHARLRRLALWAFLGLRALDRPARSPYLRVLAANGRGREVLRLMKESAALPIVTRPARAEGEEARRLLALESRCTDLYGLCLPGEIPAGGREWRQPPAMA